MGGPIPESIGRLINIDTIDLSYNQLSGSIPSCLAQIAELDYLNLANNRLSGPIPREMFDLKSECEVDISNNFLLDDEEIPEAWSKDNAFQILRKPKMMGCYQSRSEDE